RARTVTVGWKKPVPDATASAPRPARRSRPSSSLRPDTFVISALLPCRPFVQPNRARDRGHPQCRYRQDEPPGSVATQGRDRQTAGAKACRKGCAPEDSKDLGPEAPKPEHLRRA